MTSYVQSLMQKFCVAIEHVKLSCNQPCSLGATMISTQSRTSLKRGLRHLALKHVGHPPEAKQPDSSFAFDLRTGKKRQPGVRYVGLRRELKAWLEQRASRLLDLRVF
ncbi:hypothetical protein [Bradyrhizobium sp. Gha]|uniref:hypothetical protein n=1 Tax=Bradyrhizobium sp. Gha TaxID=1855318 RepID=UPI0011604B6A|nr:hypothetical protein [Bradyrhizobium sp. Gha]